jgi:hypothetical protein
MWTPALPCALRADAVQKSVAMVRFDRGLELACDYLVAEVRRAWPWHWKQGPRRPPLASGSDVPAVRLVTDFRMKGVSDDAARGVAAWSRGLDVAVFDRVPGPLEVLRLQSLGGRCVSLLSADVPASPHESALEFLLHDLCHLGKFADPRYYREQVGFFATFAGALERPGWLELEAELDDEWISARDQVLCDMNGSSVFLFAAFKMKLKMAARRKVARIDARAPVLYGPLDRGEERCFGELLAHALALLGLDAAELRAAALSTSARRDCPRAAAVISEHFREVGAKILDRSGRVKPRGGASAAGRSPPAR